MRHTRGRGVFVRRYRGSGGARKERSDGIAIVALVRHSRQRQVRIPLQDTGKPADVAGFHWRRVVAFV